MLRQAKLHRIRFHDLRHSAATLLLEQWVELVVIKELFGAHPHRRHRHRVRPRPAPPPARRHRPSRPRSPQPRRDHRQARRRRRPPSAQPPSADVAVNYCRQTSQRPHRDIIPVGPLGLSLAVIDRESPAGRPSFASDQFSTWRDGKFANTTCNRSANG
ncbi:hypothetical protein ACFRNT_35275 [Streptomyces sp. NPDC056697]|uniref:hypothetical protein n=1 Tax=Streptomyces sp. NPDC056697 TaxID=3345915 RepID=UPI003691D74A